MLRSAENKDEPRTRSQCADKADFIDKLRGQLRASSEQQSCTQSAQNQESYVLAQSCSERSENLFMKKCAQSGFSQVNLICF
jgi:hypothetical protein